MAKSAKPRTDQTGTRTAGRPPTAPPPGPAHVTEDEIARRAYDRYLTRGREDGHDLEDWFYAEQEVRHAKAV